MTDESRHNSDPFMDFSMATLKIEDDILQLVKDYKHNLLNEEYWSRIAELATRFFAYLNEGLQTFPEDLSVEMESEMVARALSPNMLNDFALKFIELVYASINDPLFSIDAIDNPGPLRRALQMSSACDTFNRYVQQSGTVNFYV
jgi:hypothetical protein